MKIHDEELEIAIKNGQIEKAEKIIEQQIKVEKNNIQLWLKLAVTVIAVPIVDYVKSLECLEKVYDLDKDNLQALVFECCIYRFCLGGIDDRLLDKLRVFETKNVEELSIIKYIMSWYYETLNVQMQRRLLEDSITHCDSYVNNYIDLAEVYIKDGEVSSGYKLLNKAYENIKVFYNSENKSDFTNINDYINEFVTGTHKSYINVKNLREKILYNDKSK